MIRIMSAFITLSYTIGLPSRYPNPATVQSGSFDAAMRLVSLADANMSCLSYHICPGNATGFDAHVSYWLPRTAAFGNALMCGIPTICSSAPHEKCGALSKCAILLRSIWANPIAASQQGVSASVPDHSHLFFSGTPTTTSFRIAIPTQAIPQLRLIHHSAVDHPKTDMIPRMATGAPAGIRSVSCPYTS